MKTSSASKLTPLGRALKSYRVDHDLVQKDMANSIGVSPAYLSSCEIGKRNISNDALVSISNCYPELKIEFLENLKSQSSTLIKLNLFDMKDSRRQSIKNIIDASLFLSDKELENLEKLIKGHSPNDL